MQERPSGLSDDDLVRGLADGWGLRALTLSYLPAGAGGYHWVVSDGAERWFVTVNADVDADRLEQALGTALALERDAGLDFVLAPVPTGTGTATWRLSERHTLSVYPMVDGVAGLFGPHRADERDELLDLLIALHGATPATARRTDLRLPGRKRLEDALGDLGGPWTGGPYSEPARELLATHAARVNEWLANFDHLAAEVPDADWVVTHGEPHPGNVMRTAGGPLLIDWDTVLLAPPERDLWMLTSAMIGSTASKDDALLERYRRATGRAVRRDGIAFYRLWWILADIAVYADQLRQPHVAGVDLADSLSCLRAGLED